MEEAIQAILRILISKVAKSIFSWHNKFLYFGGKQVLNSHVLQSMPISLLQAMSPTKRVIGENSSNFCEILLGKGRGNKR